MDDSSTTCMATHKVPRGTDRTATGAMFLQGPPTLAPDNALFLDVDGTLLDLADTPDDVQCPPGLPELLCEVSSTLDGAIAIVSGRSLGWIDALFRPVILAGAGVYGAEMRLEAGGSIEAPEVPEVADLATRLYARFRNDDRIVVENKNSAVAIHFRRAPERGAECRSVLAALAACPPLKIIQGKCVVEACPAVYDKGSSLLRIMAVHPFRGRRPVFVGDDRSDEVAFEAAAVSGGYGIKVGEGATIAACRIESVARVANWLRANVRRPGAAQP